MEKERRAPVNGQMGIWLREMRREKGWSIAHVIRTTKACSSQHLSMVENGQRRPSLALFTQLCEAYGAPSSVVEGLDEASAQFTVAERDRYTLMRIICVLDDAQRRKLHRVVAPMLATASKRRTGIVSPQEEATGHVLPGEVGGD